MLPLFASEAGALCLKPTVQQVFEQLFDFGLREFCFIVGKKKRALEDHFTPDQDYVQQLTSHWRTAQASQLKQFYDRIEASTIVWMNQPKPQGFGHAVLQAEPFVRHDSFLVHAGDTYIISRETSIHTRLLETHSTSGADATFAVQQLSDPRQHGVAEVRGADGDSLQVIGVEEKPTRPKSKFAIMPLYIFTESIFDSLRKTKSDRMGETQLTDAMQGLIDSGRKVQAVSLRPNDIRLDIGTPETYWEALDLSYHNSKQTPTAV
jgi:UTP--glucose-1-phosphate uridylyltransferase